MQVECVCLRVDWRDCYAEVDKTDILCGLCAEHYEFEWFLLSCKLLME